MRDLGESIATENGNRIRCQISAQQAVENESEQGGIYLKSWLAGEAENGFLCSYAYIIGRVALLILFETSHG